MKRREASKDDDSVSVRSLASKRSQAAIGGSKLKDSASTKQVPIDEEEREGEQFTFKEDLLVLNYACFRQISRMIAQSMF